MPTLLRHAAENLSVNVAPSALGTLALLLQGDEVLACVFGHVSEKSAMRALGQCQAQAGFFPANHGHFISPACDQLIDRLVRFTAGEDVDFSDVSIHMADRSPFQRRVIDTCRAIPRGETRTYGELAQAAGSPGAARAVGSVMATNRVPLIVPCHRVVAAGGGLGGFSAPQGIVMKQRLLKLEQANFGE